MPKRPRLVPQSPPRRRAASPASPGPLMDSQHRLDFYPPATPRTTRKQALLRRSLFETLPPTDALTMPRHRSSSTQSRRSRTPSPAARPAASSPRRRPDPEAAPSSPRRRPDPEHPYMEELTQALTGINHILERQVLQPCVQPQQFLPPQEQGQPEDPAFDWGKLYQAPDTAFPPVSTGKVQRIAAGLLAKFPAMTGRDRHEVAYLLTMASDFPNMPRRLADATYQCMNLLYIAAYHGWATAIAASGSVGSSEAVFPPGFQPPVSQRRQVYQPPMQQPQPRQENPPPYRRRGQPPRRGRGQSNQQD